LFVFGLVAALLATRTGRLGPGIWAHVAFNLTAVISLLH
jgi:membrane protease YdiL (CAAX protease family)